MICEMILLVELLICTSVGIVPLPPPIEEMPLAVTNYWPFDNEGNLFDGWQGQCDSDCSVTANGTKVTPDIVDKSAACISDWVFRGRTIKLIIGNKSYDCIDTFGDMTYRAPFYHHRWGVWVIPVDLLTETPTYYLTYDWSKGW